MLLRWSWRRCWCLVSALIAVLCVCTPSHIHMYVHIHIPPICIIFMCMCVYLSFIYSCIHTYIIPMYAHSHGPGPRILSHSENHLNFAATHTTRSVRNEQRELTRPQTCRVRWPARSNSVVWARACAPTLRQRCALWAVEFWRTNTYKCVCMCVSQGHQRSSCRFRTQHWCKALKLMELICVESFNNSSSV